ncbi:hypothetical protein BRD04_02960 [Halobacteriales archaeon QS_9_67_17]|nr:MAG: hypothetical protein BRD04_02960 [Halobacteriales archaeon QS_9_67_17]
MLEARQHRRGFGQFLDHRDDCEHERDGHRDREGEQRRDGEQFNHEDERDDEGRHGDERAGAANPTRQRVQQFQRHWPLGEQVLLAVESESEPVTDGRGQRRRDDGEGSLTR